MAQAVADAKLDDIQRMAISICDTALNALIRYHQLTDLSPSEVPEHFIQSFIFDRLGDHLSMTMETAVPTLWLWGGGGDIPPELRKIDIVIYNKKQQIKKEQDALVLVEIKRHHDVGSDIYKLQKILPKLRTLKYGIVVGIIDPVVWSDWLVNEPELARRDNKEFVTSSTTIEIESGGSKRQFAAFA
jgi:hypothetical protein